MQAGPLIDNMSFVDVIGNWMHPLRRGPTRVQVNQRGKGSQLGHLQSLSSLAEVNPPK